MKNKRKEKNITFLNFDHTLTEQKFLRNYPHHWIDCSNIPHKNGFCEYDSLNMIRKLLQNNGASPLTLIGNGNYHYVTYLLLERVKEPFSLLLFDHHDDMMDDGTDLISCGSWVNYALKDHPLLNKVVIIGVNEENLTAKTVEVNSSNRVHIVSKQRINKTRLHEVGQEVRSFLNEETNIYISVDKDVLYKKEAFTNWDQGNMTLVQLLFFLEYFGKHYHVLGMDICGEYVTDYNHVFDPATWENVKMNEIVNRALIGFVHELAIYKLKQKTIT